MAIQILPREGSFMQALGSALGGGIKAGADQYVGNKEMQQKFQQQQQLEMLKQGFKQQQLGQQQMQKEQKLQSYIPQLKKLGVSDTTIQELLDIGDDKYIQRLIMGETAPAKGFFDRIVGKSDSNLKNLDQSNKLQDLISMFGGGQPQPQMQGGMSTGPQEQSQSSPIEQARANIFASDLSPEEKMAAFNDLASLTNEPTTLIGLLSNLIGGGAASIGGLGSLLETGLRGSRAIEGKSIEDMVGFLSPLFGGKELKEEDRMYPSGPLQLPETTLPTSTDLRLKMGAIPRTSKEKFAGDVGESLPFIYEFGTPGIVKGVAKALGKGVAVKGAGDLTRKITGSEIAGNAVELATLVGINMYNPGYLNKTRFSQYNEFNQAAEGLPTDKKIVPNEQFRKELGPYGSLGREVERGAVKSKAKIYLGERLNEIENTFVPGTNKLNMAELNNLYKEHQRMWTEIPKVAKSTRSVMRDVLEAEKEQLIKWGDKVIPKATKAFKSAEGITKGISARNAIREAAKEAPNLLPLGPLRPVINAAKSVAGLVGGEFSDIIKHPAIRNAYFEVAKEAAKGPSHHNFAAKKLINLGRAIKKHNPDAFKRLSQEQQEQS